MLTVSGETLGRDARLVGEIRAPCASCAQVLRERDGIDPGRRDHGSRRGAPARPDLHGDVSARAISRPEGSVIKSTAIDPSVVDADGVYRKTGPARVFRTETAAIAAIKSHGPDRIQPGDVSC